MALKTTARLAGLLWLLFAVAIGIGLSYLRSVSFEPAAMGQNPNLVLDLRLGIVATLAAHLFMLAFGVTLFHLFRGVSETLRTILLVSVAISVTLGVANSVNHLAGVVLLSGGEQLRPLGENESAALAFLFARLANSGLALLEIFWAAFFFCFGMLVLKSGYLPRIFGFLLILMSIGYPLNSFSKLLVPSFYPGEMTQLATLLGGLGGIPTMAWLLLKGASADRPSGGARQPD